MIILTFTGTKIIPEGTGHQFDMPTEFRGVSFVKEPVVPTTEGASETKVLPLKSKKSSTGSVPPGTMRTRNKARLRKSCDNGFPAEVIKVIVITDGQRRGVINESRGR